MVPFDRSCHYVGGPLWLTIADHDHGHDEGRFAPLRTMRSDGANGHARQLFEVTRIAGDDRTAPRERRRRNHEVVRPTWPTLAPDL